MKQQARILIVEDDALQAMDLARTIEEFGYEVCGIADSGAKAIVKAADASPELILMDIGLGKEMDGIAAAKAILAHSSVPIVFLTGDAEEETLQRARLSKPYGYLIKPFDPHELKATLERILRYQEQGAATADGLESLVEEEAPLLDAPGTDLSTKARLLSKLSLFQDLPEIIIDAVGLQVNEQSHDAGSYLVNEGIDPNGGFIVLSGRVSITKTSLGGKELIVASLAPGSTFGLLYTLPDFSRSTAARCQIASRVLWITTKVYERLSQEYPLLQARTLKELSCALALSYRLSSSLAHQKVEVRIVSALVALLPQFGRGGTEENQGRIYMTRRELADLVGTTPETAIRVTKTLEREGLLDLARPGIIKILDVSRLSELEMLKG